VRWGERNIEDIRSTQDSREKKALPAGKVQRGKIIGAFDTHTFKQQDTGKLVASVGNSCRGDAGRQ
jgi:hypothetical protein